jgi:hypothetical protein
MKWKTVGQIAKWTAIAVVPGAAGYVAYRYVVRPWLDTRAAKKKADAGKPEYPAPPEESEVKGGSERGERPKMPDAQSPPPN